MAFFEQIGKKITNAGQSVAQQTKNFADVTQLNSAISESEKKISQLFLNIGQMYYEAHKHDHEAEYQENITEHGSVAETNDRVHKICPVCHSAVDPEDSFCNHCGAKIENI